MVKNQKKFMLLELNLLQIKYVIGYTCQSTIFKWVRVVKYINENASEKTVKLDFLS